MNIKGKYYYVIDKMNLSIKEKKRIISNITNRPEAKRKMKELAKELDIKIEKPYDFFVKDDTAYGISLSSEILDKVNNMKTQKELDAIGADIRNKLGPFLTLVTLLDKQKEVDDEMKVKLQKYIDDATKQSKISIEYLKNLL